MMPVHRGWVLQGLKYLSKWLHLPPKYLLTPLSIYSPIIFLMFPVDSTISSFLVSHQTHYLWNSLGGHHSLLLIIALGGFAFTDEV